MKTSHGFTLLELIVVVAIIGVLALVAVPEYSKLVAKTRTVEAKTALASLYIGQISFEAEVGGYTVCIPLTGFAPAQSNRYYAVGFHNVDYSYATCSGDCNKHCPPARGYSAGSGVNQFYALMSANSLPPADDTQMNVLPTNIGDGFFVVCAAGSISSRVPPPIGLQYDAWCIDNNKLLTHVETGY